MLKRCMLLACCVGCAESTPSLGVKQPAGDASPDTSSSNGVNEDSGVGENNSVVEGTVAQQTAPLTYDGSIVVPAVPGMGVRDVSESVGVEISGPVFPNVMVLYQHEAAQYPQTMQAEQALVLDAAMSYPFLRDTCAQMEAYDIVLADDASGVSLDAASMAQNYDQVAQCAYEQFTSKPYWIPQLVDHVDVCGLVLGEGWRLITEQDLEALTYEQRVFIQEHLSGLSSEGSWMGSFYFSMNMYVRAKDGALRRADIDADLNYVFSEIPASYDGEPRHFEGSYGLRCIR